MKITDIKTGDSILVTNYNNFLSNTIRKVMFKFGKQENIITDTILSHACTAVWIDNELYAFGSVESGYKPWLFKLHYSLQDLNRNGIVVMRRNEPLSKEEEVKLRHYCIHLNTISIAYQFWNFIQWLAYVYCTVKVKGKRFRLNLFTKDADAFNYCYESGMLCRKWLNPDNYKDCCITSFFDLYFDSSYHVVYKNIKM
jgi:hypothetical protein